jgi:hypothetical protein
MKSFLLVLYGVLMGAKPPAEKWAFSSRRLKYRVGGENKE